jgi:hypothetical protein
MSVVQRAIRSKARTRRSTPEQRRPRAWTSQQWCDYYRRNATRLLALPWEGGACLSDNEKSAIAASLQEFQIGEQSEGHNLLRRARQHADRTGDPAYAEAVAHFIAEEQRHARDLGRLLTCAGVPLLQRSRLDRAFRWLRRLAGLGLMLMVLLTAEAIGKVYYLAIRRATRSPLLRRLCDQLERDEVQHLRFHAERLALMRARWGRWRLALVQLSQRCLLWATCGLVWCRHRRALRAGGLTFRRFLRECRQVLAGILHLANPRRYRR